MDWTPGGLSGDVEDRRGSSGGGGGGGGGFGGGGLGIVGFIVLAIISLLTGRNYIGSYLSGHVAPTQTQSGYSRPAAPASPQENRSAQLVSFVLDDVQRTWTTLLPEQTHRNYRQPNLVFFATYTHP